MDTLAKIKAFLEDFWLVLLTALAKVGISTDRFKDLDIATAKNVLAEGIQNAYNKYLDPAIRKYSEELLKKSEEVSIRTVEFFLRKNRIMPRVEELENDSKSLKNSLLQVDGEVKNIETVLENLVNKIKEKISADDAKEIFNRRVADLPIPSRSDLERIVKEVVAEIPSRTQISESAIRETVERILRDRDNVLTKQDVLAILRENLLEPRYRGLEARVSRVETPVLLWVLMVFFGLATMVFAGLFFFKPDINYSAAQNKIASLEAVIDEQNGKIAKLLDEVDNANGKASSAKNVSGKVLDEVLTAPLKGGADAETVSELKRKVEEFSDFKNDQKLINSKIEDALNLTIETTNANLGNIYKIYSVDGPSPANIPRANF